jgi:hypothetical protein
MSKIVGVMFLAVLIGTSVVAWSRSGPPARPANQMSTISTHEMHQTPTVRSLTEQRMHDMSFVFSNER